MLRPTILATVLLAATPAFAAISDPALEDAARAVDARVVEWRRDIHQHPELGNREFRTAKIVADAAARPRASR